MSRLTFYILNALLLFFGAITPLFAGDDALSQQGKLFTLRGNVADEEGEPVGLATVKAVGTQYGAIVSKDGTFISKIPFGDYVFTCSRIGYATDTIRLNISADTTITFRLRASNTSLPEVVVSAERPAERLMRRVIERKQRLSKSLETYSYTLYSKFVASTDTLTAGRVADESDTTVVAILESYSKGYFRRPNDYFNEIFQRRQSANIPATANIAAFGTALNLFDDNLNLLSEIIATPFHPNALDYYVFDIEYYFSEEGTDYASVSAVPQSNFRKLLPGKIIIDTSRAVPVRFTAKPNKAVQMPFDADVVVEQTYQTVCDSGYVQPLQTHVTGTAKADFLFVLSPRLDIDIETIAYNFICNANLSPALFSRRRIEALPEARLTDSTFWAENVMLPLKSHEVRAYQQIQTALEDPDSVVTAGIMNAIFAPVNRVIRQLNTPPFTGFEDIIAYNRVHGAYLGMGLFDTLGSSLILTGKAGYGIADRRWYGEAKAEWQFGEAGEYSLIAHGYSTLLRRDNPNIVRKPLITTAAILARADYGDYYYADGGELSWKIGWGQLRFMRRNEWDRPSTFRLFLKAESHFTALRNTNFALLGRADTFRLNPPIQEGNLRSFGGELRLNFSPFRRISAHGGLLMVEHAPHNFLGNNFNFTTLTGSYFLRTPTLPLWQLDLRLNGGISFGEIPPQRFFSLETGIGALNTGGTFRTMGVKEFYGDRFFAINFEHNFGELVPGLLRIPNIAALGLEFVLTGGLGYTSFRPDTFIPEMPLPSIAETTDGYFGEIGLAINKLFLFFRIDITARISQRQRPQFFFTFQPAVF